MERLRRIILFATILFANGLYAQKLVLTTAGIRASDNPSKQYVEYSYRDGVGKKDLKDYCVQKLSQPDFFSYRVDYEDEQTIKLNGYTKKNFKGLRFEC